MTMTDSAALVPLGGAAGGAAGDAELVVAVDFGGARPEAGFSDLAGNLPARFAVEVTKPPTELSSDGGARRQLDLWKAAITATGRPVAAVVGYCVGASIATRLVAELRADGSAAPVLVLVDPSWPGPGPDLLNDVYRQATEALLGALGESSAEPEPAPCFLPGGDGDDPEAALTVFALDLLAGYAGTAARVAGRLDLPTQLMDDLVHRFARYLSYLVVACAAADSATIDALVEAPATLTVSSATHPAHEQVAPGLHLRFDLPRGDLLADEAVARTVSEFMSTRASSPVPGGRECGR